MTIRLLALVALLMVPSATAAGFPSEHVITWQQHVHNANAPTGWDGDVVPVTLTRPHTWDVLASTIIVGVSLNTAIEGDGVTRSFRVNIDGVLLEFCTQSITTEGVLANRWAFGGGGLCPPTNGGAQRAVIGTEQDWSFTTTGSGAINFLNANVFVTVQETVITMTSFEELTGLTALEFMALLGVAIVGVVLWSRSTDYAVRAFGAALPMLGGLISIFAALNSGLGSLWPGAMALGAILMLVGVYLEIRMAWDAFTGGNAT